MSLLMIAAWFAAAGAVTMIGLGVYAITLDRSEDHPQTTGACTPSRYNTLTGAHAALDRRDQTIRERDAHISALERQCEELGDQLEFVPVAFVGNEQQAAEIERLRAVIRQRNRTIKRLRTELEQQQAEQRPALTVAGADRFEWLEIRGQSCE